jgi:hypothetical protein
MLLKDIAPIHVNSLTHEGKIVIIGTDDQKKLWYTVQQQGFEPSKDTVKVRGWENWQLLNLPNESTDQSVIDKEQRELTNVKDGKPIIRSLYKTDDQTAIAPVQIISAFGHLYVFRQSLSNTLLVDRFVLDGGTNELKRKLDVRFKRSCKKYTPLAGDEKNLNNDSLDFKDSNNKLFLEPTTELSFVNNLIQGWFSVVLLPTNEHDNYRWQIFACNEIPVLPLPTTGTPKVEKKIVMFSVRASDEGLFDVKDGVIMEPHPEKDGVLLPRTIAGIITRTLNLRDASNQTLNVANGFTATRYDVQQEQETKAGKQLLKCETRVMLAVPTHDGNTAAVSFAIATDGTLSQINETIDRSTVLRGEVRQILLPLDTLDQVKAIGGVKAAAGDIALMKQASDSSVEGKVQIKSAMPHELCDGDVVKVLGTPDYNGCYEVTKVNGDVFEITTTWVGSQLGTWEQEPQEATGLIFDGAITSFEKTSDQKIKVTSANHQLQIGDQVQIKGTQDCNDKFPIIKVDDNNFVIDRKWQPSEAVNIKLESSKRRGLMMDGVSDSVDLASTADLGLKGSSFTIEVWIRGNEFNAGDYRTDQAILGNNSLATNNGLHLVVRDRRAYMGFSNNDTSATTILKDNTWYHLAFRYNKETQEQAIFVNGKLDIKVEGHLPFNGDGIVQIGRRLDGQNFNGTIADLRIWNSVRSETEIANTMYLQLLGRETNLMGSWRLGGIVVEKDESRVIDFSVYSRHGKVKGSPYIQEVSLARKMADPLNAAAKIDVAEYRNNEYFAVSQYATYEESFEFRVAKVAATKDTPAPIADGFFAFNYWGKQNLSSEDCIKINDDIRSRTTIEPLKGGWYRAKCQVMIPEGIRLLRLFGLSELKGSWENLEIRRHQICIVSDAISQDIYTDNLPLALLANPQVTPGINLTAKVQQFVQSECQESLLLDQKNSLDLKIAAYNNLAASQARVIELKAKKVTLSAELANAKNRLDNEKANPLNYWCSIRSRRTIDDSGSASLTCKGTDLNDNIRNINSLGSGVIRFKFIPAGDGGYFNIISEFEDRVIDVICTDVHRICATTDHQHGSNGQRWKLEKNSEGYYAILSRILHNGSPRILDLNMGGQSIVMAHENRHNGHNQQWAIYICNSLTTVNNVVAAAESEYNDKDRQLEACNRELKALEEAVNGDIAKLAGWKALLEVVKLKLNKIQHELAQYNDILVRSTPAVGRGAPPISIIATDRQNLKTTGAQLGFVRPSSRLTALETCEGNVQLSYIDDQGRLQTTDFDATADSRNAVFERWIPNAYRTCLRFDGDDQVVCPSALPLAYSSFTIEFWAKRSQLDSWDVAIGQKHPKEKNKGLHIGFRANNTFTFGFYNNDLDTPIVYIDTDWHYWACVYDYDTKVRRIYCDGLEVAKDDTKDVLDANKVVTQAKGDLLGTGTLLFGQMPDVGFFKGQLSEIRIWGMALTEEEIVVNSKCRLTGNEPGLLSYYPLNEGTGTTVSDQAAAALEQSTNQSVPKAEIQGATWWACTAPMGSLGTAITRLNGQSANNIDLVSAETLGLKDSSFTIEAWIKNEDLNEAGFSTTRVVAGTNSDILNKGLRLSVEGRNVCMDFWSNSTTSSTVLESNIWYHVAWRYDKTKKTQSILINGELDCVGTGKEAFQGSDLVYIGRAYGGCNFKGSIAEVRIWNTARTDADIKTDRFKRLTGKEANLKGYYPLDDIISSPSAGSTATTPGTTTKEIKNLVSDQPSGKVVGDLTTVYANDLSLAGNVVLCNEYSTVDINPQSKAKTALIRRFFALSIGNGVNVLPGKRVEDLETLWIGNAQFKPTLLGYIEGAPPVPSENLTIEENYNGATSVEITQSNDMSYSWERSDQETLKFDASITLGWGFKIGKGIGVTTEVDAKAGRQAKLSSTENYSNSSKAEASMMLGFADRLDLRGTQEITPKFPALGKRFVPKNVGYALVVSGLADVFVTRLRRSGKMISYNIHPNDDIPLDINTITFLMNPAYTMQGSLDGMTGTAATSDRFFRQVPEMRSQYGSKYPASYFKLKDAYQLKDAIQTQDKSREAFYQNFDSTKTTSGKGLETETSHASEEASPEVMKNDEPSKSGTSTSNTSNTKEVTDKNKEKEKGRIQGLAEKAKELTGSHKRADWQNQMDLLRDKARKRNIVNTYVWDADGGLRTETQQFASVVEHTIGGAYSLEAGAGGAAKTEGDGIWLDVAAMVSGGMTLTMSKTESYSQGFALNVDVSGMESRGVTDYKDNPLMPGEKVNRYRFMSFYLEGSTEHFKDFFSYVVDPEWLASNAEEARALRGVDVTKANKTWRVLHRVTYVERPALMNFGRDLRSVSATEPAAPTNQELQLKLEQLEVSNKILEDKLDKIAEMLRSTSTST